MQVDKFNPLTAYELRIKALEVAARLYESSDYGSTVNPEVVVKLATEFLDFFVEEFYTPIFPEDDIHEQSKETI